MLLLEVGVGGCLDPANCFDADVTAITNIALDHVGLLGSTRDEIALNKVGIVRKDAPLVIGDPCPPDSLIEFVTENDIKAYFIGKGFNKLPTIKIPGLHPNNVATFQYISYLQSEKDLKTSFESKDKL